MNPKQQSRTPSFSIERRGTTLLGTSLVHFALANLSFWRVLKGNRVHDK